MLHKLIEVQTKLKAPKSQFNSFGKYSYRNCEDILEAVKPLLKEQGLCLTISDEIVGVSNRVYVKATATISDGENFTTTTAFAREEETKKGMDASQITGAASSYARKYALNGLFCIDDTKDADNTPATAADTPKTNDTQKADNTDAVITDAEFKGLVAICKNAHGKVLYLECFNDYKTERGLKSIKDLRKSKIADITKYIEKWEDARLPPDIG